MARGWSFTKLHPPESVLRTWLKWKQNISEGHPACGGSVEENAFSSMWGLIKRSDEHGMTLWKHPEGSRLSSGQPEKFFWPSMGPHFPRWVTSWVRKGEISREWQQSISQLFSDPGEKKREPLFGLGPF